MPGPAPRRIAVSACQRRVVERIVRRETRPRHQVRRAQIVLSAADGVGMEQVAQRARVREGTARLWRRRWELAGEALVAAEAEGDDRAREAIIQAVLADEPRAGAPAMFTAEQFRQIMALACLPPEEAGRPIDAWTPRALADEAAQRGIVACISPSTVRRFFTGGRSQAASEPLLAHASAR